MANEQEPVGMPTDDELFRQAMADPPPPQPEAPPPAEPPKTSTEPGQPLRDEHGRFVAKDQPAAAQPPETAQPPQPGQPPPAQKTDDDGNDVPSWRHREIRLEKAAAEERARQLEAAFIAQQQEMRRLREEFQRAQQPPKPPDVPDVITDPQGYTTYLTQQFEQRMRNQEANFSFRLAHDRYGEQFERAYGDMINRAERGDPSIVRAVMASPDPGAAMMSWFQRETTLQMVGNDPEKWFEATLEQRLKDQKYAGTLLERMRGGVTTAQQANGGGPVQLPPSLNRMAAAAPALPDTGDMSDASMFDYAFRRDRMKR